MGKDRMLGKGATRTLKGFHVAFVTSSAGGTVSMLALLLVKFFTNLYGNDFPIDLSIFKIFNTVILYAYFGIIVTSVLYSLFTPVKFFRLNWVTVKWTLLVIIFLLAWVRLGPAISGMTSLSDAGFHVTVSQEEYALHMKNALVFASIQTALLILIVFISTIKPWGERRERIEIKRKIMVSIVGGIALVILFFAVSSTVRHHRYRTMPIEDTDLSSLQDGNYHGEAFVGNYLYKVEATVREGQITDIKAIDNRESPYAFYAEGVFKKIVRDRNANTDAVTGATTTSKALMKAVENALQADNRVR